MAIIDGDVTDPALAGDATTAQAYKTAAISVELISGVQTIDGAVTESASAGSMSATAGCLAEAHLYKSGTLIPGATVARTISNGGDKGAFAVSAQVSLDDGQYVELWVESDGVQDITIESGVLSAKVIG